MRAYYDSKLNELNDKLVGMGALIENAINHAVAALTQKNVAEAQKVSELEDKINDAEKEIEAFCLKLILHQQPVAGDLRLISAALKMITDMERIGDQAEDVSEICILLSKNSYVHNLEHIKQMAEHMKKMVTDSINAFVTKDIVLAMSVCKNDDIIDDLFVKVRQDMIELISKDSSKGEVAFDLLMVAKYFERIGDHATNIAEWVIYSINGDRKI
ncbi:MAG: phosphate signaling complex protein PhoU [bacterium]|nr:phosphate signaling complex protein PhoU [bacterium]MDD6225020.1 phosphate signaling complex protein PhoU [bacterium]MDY3861626.1 phosphate signaling complex protein PhoU [Ruminococcus sp.]